MADKNVSPIFFITRLLGVFFFARRKRILTHCNYKHISLINPEIRSIAESCNINYFEFDIFKTSSKRFHFIRRMNLLNLSYFSVSKIQMAIRLT